MPNRLAAETSPYLLQHANNPVDWYPWGPEALARAKAEDRPILLSIGYSACHWCHVMERESFEDAGTAARMNRDFVNIKVDREERPDLDELYMRAVQAFTGGHGGWPMTVFLTPDGTPYFGGTYFPPRAANGMPAFADVLESASRAYRAKTADLSRTTDQIRDYLRSSGRLPRGGDAVSPGWLQHIARAAATDFDEERGGFGDAPKFPPHGQLAALLAWARQTGDPDALRMVTVTLDAMARGGMYDLLGGGFARYSVDADWRVPHFEKMLYDNAQLAPIYLDAFRMTGEPQYGRICRETLDWMLREMCGPDGAFHSSLDADSEGVEGRFYAWTPEQLREALGARDGDRAARLLDVTPAGTFEHGTSVLRLDEPPEARPDEERDFLAKIFPKLLAARRSRVRPGKDDKIVTAWNALAISAFARAGAVFDAPHYRGAATRAARFLLEKMTVNGRLMRTARAGKVHIPAFADDHAFLVQALIDTWEATFDPHWLEAANALADRTIALFWDDCDAGLFYTGSDTPEILARGKHLLGGAEPSANAVAALAFARLATLCGRDDLGERADAILTRFEPLLERAPRALGIEAIAAAWRTGATQEIGIVGGAAEALLREVYRRYLPFSVVAWLPPVEEPAHAAARVLLPWMEGKTAHGHATAYVCEGTTCLVPCTDAAELGAQLDALTSPRAPAPEEAPPRVHAPALPTDPAAWLNTDTVPQLKGQVVVLDFWTFCCINCMHVLPELAAVEEATQGQPVVIVGVHSAKFPAERERDNVLRAIRRDQVRHPVVLDPDHTIWESYGVRAWPTVVVIDATGRIAWQQSGEVTRRDLLAVVNRLLEEGREQGTLATEPAWTLPEPAPAGHGLHFPGKIAVWPDLIGQSSGKPALGADARLYVADTGNHRIVEAALTAGPDGWPTARILRVFGGNGPGLRDGGLREACFRSPQGLARAGDTLWVADTGNHLIRTIDLNNCETRTVAGTGRLGRGAAGDPSQPLKVPLRSPWDVAVASSAEGKTDAVFIAMAGAHQIWIYLPDEHRIGPFAGSGREDHIDGAPSEAALAQPSGLSQLGRYLFFADSETSSIRVFDLGANKVGTLCGQGLFDFGDVDGRGEGVRLQHPLAVAATPDGVLYVADTYNDKIKAITLRTLEVRTVVAGLSEPGGLAVAGDFLLVADTNHHAIRALHRETGELRDVPVLPA